MLDDISRHAQNDRSKGVVAQQAQVWAVDGFQGPTPAR